MTAIRCERCGHVYPVIIRGVALTCPWCDMELEAAKMKLADAEKAIRTKYFPGKEVGLNPNSQTNLARNLGLSQAAGFLGKKCEKCGKKLGKRSKTNLCPDHYREYRRQKSKLRMRQKRSVRR